VRRGDAPRPIAAAPPATFASTAAALVGAAVLSTLIYPFLALRIRGWSDAAPRALALELE